MLMIRSLFFMFCFFINVDVQAVPFTKASVEEALLSEIMQKVSFSEFEISLDTWQTAWAKINVDGNLTLVEMTITPDNKRFTAVVSWGDHTNGGVTKKLSGKIRKFMTLPVLTTSMGKDERIKESDLAFIRFQEDQINPGMILKKEDLIGKNLKNGRGLNINKPLMKNDVEVPIIVKRGEQVRIKYISPHFEISVQGVAKSNGAAGERISFENPAKKIINAVVLESGIAEIRES